MNTGKNGGFYRRTEWVSLQRLTLFQALTVSLPFSLCQGICQSSQIFSFFFFFFSSLRCHRGHREVRMSRGGEVDE